jgi:hypothetical protein
LSIKEILKDLSAAAREFIFNAFEEEVSATFEYAPGKFIGVHFEGSQDKTILKREGVWCIGKYNSVRSS